MPASRLVCHTSLGLVQSPVECNFLFRHGYVCTSHSRPIETDLLRAMGPRLPLPTCLLYPPPIFPTSSLPIALDRSRSPLLGCSIEQGVGWGRDRKQLYTGGKNKYTCPSFSARKLKNKKSNANSIWWVASPENCLPGWQVSKIILFSID